MKKLALGALLFALLVCSIRTAPAVSGGTCNGDSALAAAGSFKIYPFFTTNGGHIHNSQWVADAAGNLTNGYGQASRFYLRTTLSNLRVNVFGPAGTDSSGFTILAGEAWVMPSGVKLDSCIVLNTGGTATTVTFGCAQ